VKRWVWLAALPYVVTVSTSQGPCKREVYSSCVSNVCFSQECAEREPDEFSYSIEISTKPGIGKVTFQERDVAEDVAEALNQAHERRTSGCKDPQTMCMDDPSNPYWFK
jgi:hypothetical protein